MKRKDAAVLADGHPRRMSDARNAWRKMDPSQRMVFICWLIDPDNSSESDLRVIREIAAASAR